MPLVAGVDSSTQSCKVVICDAETGRIVREGRAGHPDGTQVDPSAWWSALQEAIAAAGGLDDVEAISVGGQQHGMVALDERGQVVRPAMLWNDTSSAGAAADLVDELGAQFWAEVIGTVPPASLTVTKLRWLAEHEPDNAAKVAAVALPHDWLSWKLTGAASLDSLFTDRSDASGTGYWSPVSGEYRVDLLERALGRQVAVPTVLGLAEAGGTLAYQGNSSALVGPGGGDNAAAALGLGMTAGDVAISIGTSGVVSAISRRPAADPSGSVAGFADATGQFLPLAVTLNAARVLDAAGALLGVDHDRLSALALAAPSGADGLVLVPYLEGERTPNKPHATGAVHGLTLATSTPQHLARAAVEGMLLALADGLDAMVAQGTIVDRVSLIGGGARSAAVRQVAPSVFGSTVTVPAEAEYVALGMARQAAWVLSGQPEPPTWAVDGAQEYAAPVDARSVVERLRTQYARAKELTLDR
ncbi:xylulokinase [Calidifontibacter sp. DB0510]|uniref:Xylulose kinase n=1 Tax=Metallococcus carri TaxID=1656884 RepID=A0A967EBB5_9MICO|nr:xylulokinase [Metallococcus carri]NHN56764.1 xylulokinase [Metallococcus carri]NOP37859.1 xylulokinase [Calidifontibacter sp. DB2511S]